MKQISPKLICAECGAEMNHHALKIDYSIEDGAVQEVHTCPECGRSELRQAEQIYDYGTATIRRSPSTHEALETVGAISQ